MVSVAIRACGAFLRRCSWSATASCFTTSLVDNEAACFAGHVMVGPSPCYVNDGDYVGGFSEADIASLLETLEGNYLGWSSAMAPAIMGASGKPELSEELTNSFCRTDPEIATQFAKVTFLSDNRADLARLTTAALILQSSDDFIAPPTVGEYVHHHLPNSTPRIIENTGHCPHLSEPEACIDAMQEFLAGRTGAAVG